MRYFAALLILVTNIAHADCAPVSYLKQGEVAVCTGYLFTPAKELEVRTKVEQYDTLAKIVTQQDNLIANLKSQVSNEADQLSSVKSEGTLDKVLYFILGAAVTGLVSYVAVKASH